MAYRGGACFSYICKVKPSCQNVKAFANWLAQMFFGWPYQDCSNYFDSFPNNLETQSKYTIWPNVSVALIGDDFNEIARNLYYLKTIVKTTKGGRFTDYI